MRVHWAPKLVHVRTYVPHITSEDRIVVNMLNTGAIDPQYMPYIQTGIQHRLLRKCGGQFLIPFRLELRAELKCFGFAPDAGFLAAVVPPQGEVQPESAMHGHILTPSSRVEGKLHIAAMYEATEQGGALVLLKLTFRTAAIVQELVRRAQSGIANGTWIAESILDDKQHHPSGGHEVTVTELPSGRNLNAFHGFRDVTKRW